MAASGHTKDRVYRFSLTEMWILWGPRQARFSNSPHLSLAVVVASATILSQHRERTFQVCRLAPAGYAVEDQRIAAQGIACGYELGR